MGGPKHLLRHGSSGATLLDWQWRRVAPHFQRAVLLSGRTELKNFTEAVQITDPCEFLGQGPLAALLSGLESLSPESWMAVLAVDYPYFPVKAFKEAQHLLGNHDGLVFCEQDSRRHWLCAYYHARLALPLRDALNQGERAVKKFMAQQNIRYHLLPTPHGDSAFLNLNRPEDLHHTEFQLSFRPLR